MTSFASRIKQELTLVALWVFPYHAVAVTLDMRAGVTDMSQRIQHLHHISLLICVVVAAVVFGVMFYSLIAHRRSRHPNPANFHENIWVELIWTLIPTLILIGLAIPATTTLMDIEDNSDADLTIMITASQWKWHYQYLEADFGFYSRLSTPGEQIANEQPKGEHYLLEVDQPLVLPTHKKIRLLTTSQDVIHSWWVPDFAVKQDAIPGFINEAWTRVPVPGIYRGQCTELCGKDHAFMPIVVQVTPEEEFDQWISDRRLAMALASDAAVAARNKTWTHTELFVLGEEIFLEHCATCHQPDGSGQRGKYPALAGSEIATGTVADHLNRVMYGKTDTEMQAWAPQLSDLDLAAVVTYERNAWDNNSDDIVQPLAVYQAR